MDQGTPPARDSSTIGKVYLIGAGPGDPELLTLKAARLLGEADVVVFDRLVSGAILDMVPAGVSRIYAGKALNRHHLPQDEINALLVTLASSGRTVVRLKGGDPFVFGRGSEEALTLAQAGIPFEIVPGITAASGCSAYSGIPLTHRGLATSVRYVTGHFRAGEEDMEHDWASLADPDTTLVFYMGLTNLENIANGLMSHGLPGSTPAAAIQNGTTAGQRSVRGTLEALPELVRGAGLRAPAVLVIGKVVALADDLAWFTPERAAGASDWTESKTVAGDPANHEPSDGRASQAAAG
ncbi:uroporphyrinogen-III C-methyltransferase [Novispirillum sp. DQ9]|uniref:uroporphyrinogen-III C-methyltransferase n=1 Tax=Novispirillum sp. DQ9 TaxID=3398612 RepID=UPI003C7D0E0A